MTPSSNVVNPAELSQNLRKNLVANMIARANVNDGVDEERYDDLLEPFRPRNLQNQDSSTLIRRGSLIVISTLEDSGEGLLEPFKPRTRSSTDGANDGDEESIVLEKDEGGESFQECGSFSRSNTTSRKSPQEESNLWDSFPTIQWTSSKPTDLNESKQPLSTEASPNISPKPSRPLSAKPGILRLPSMTSFRMIDPENKATAAMTEPKSEKTPESTGIWKTFPSLWAQPKKEKTQKEKDNEKLLAAIEDEEAFRALKRELRSTRMLTSAEQAVETLMARRRSIGPKRAIRRSSSFSHPLRTKEMKEILGTNLFAFRDED